MIKGFPGISDQDEAIRARWPAFRLLRQEGRAAVWRGPLRPLMATYEVQVTYQVPLAVERLDPVRQQPRVRVMSPRLRERRGDPEGDLPHVYWDDREHPSLCLFDIETGEWTPSDLIAATTLPWAADWLACYEGWRATGEWTGGGRHIPAPSQAEA